MNLSGIDIYHFDDPWPLRRQKGMALEHMPPTPFRGSYCPSSEWHFPLGSWVGDTVAGGKTRRSDASSTPLYQATMGRQTTHHRHSEVNVEERNTRVPGI